LEVLKELNVVYHVGFHKTGTTWLQNHFFTKNKGLKLLNNPNEPWKEDFLQQIITYNDCDFCENETRKLIANKGLRNKINVISAERLSGHPMSGGFDAHRIASRLYRVCPEAKVLIITRSFSSFVRSVYKQMIREGYCGLSDDFLFGPYWKTIGPSKDYFLQEKTIESYQNLFGLENVLVLTFETFKSDKHHFLNELCNFVNLNAKTADYSTTTKTVNASYSNRRARALRVLNKFRRTEINPFPMINLGTRFIVSFSKILAVFYSNRELITTAAIKKYKA
jgi:hypothetical protein